jgi:conjugal transfer pilus assembly protein TrbC
MGLLAISIGNVCYGCCGADELDIDFSVEKDEKLYVFVSMSIPENTLKEISQHIEPIGGSFVFRGLPGGSFPAFTKRVSELRKVGISADLQIDPDLFEDYQVEAVPTFVYVKDDDHKKIVGNVSVPWALREMGVSIEK